MAKGPCVLVTASRAPKVDGRRLARDVNGLHKRSGSFVLGRRLHKMAVQDQVEVKPFVACAVEGEKDRRSDVADHFALSEDVVPYAAATRKGPLCMLVVGVGFGQVIIVAMAAALWGRLTEVLEQKLPPAAEMRGVGLDGFRARPLDGAPLADEFGGLRYGLVEISRYRHLTVGIDREATRIGQRHGGGAGLVARESCSLPNVCQVGWRVVSAQGLRQGFERPHTGTSFRCVHAGQPQVFGPEVQDRIRRVTVSASPANFLVVLVQRTGDIGMKDPTDISLIDPHAERDGGDNHVEMAVTEALFGFTSRGCRQAGVIRGGAQSKSAALGCKGL